MTKNIGNKIIFVNSHALVNEVSDDKRFPKMVSAGLRELRNGAGDGLFTVRPIVDFALEVDVGKAHHFARRPTCRKSRTGTSLVRSQSKPDDGQMLTRVPLC